jgi:chromosome condensin MukBEF MukE localization factor
LQAHSAIVCHSHIRSQLLRRALLPQQKFVDELMALAIWRRLLQLMGDIEGKKKERQKIKTKLRQKSWEKQTI